MHSETSHIEKVNKLCRVCCGRCLTAKQKAQGRKVYRCSDFKREIHLIFNLQIDNDKYDTHSPNLCSACVSKLRDKRLCSLNNARVLANSTKDVWTAFKANQANSICSLCHFFDATSVGAMLSKKIRKHPNAVNNGKLN